MAITCSSIDICSYNLPKVCYFTKIEVPSRYPTPHTRHLSWFYKFLHQRPSFQKPWIRKELFPMTPKMLFTCACPYNQTCWRFKHWNHEISLVSYFNFPLDLSIYMFYNYGYRRSCWFLMDMNISHLLYIDCIWSFSLRVHKHTHNLGEENCAQNDHFIVSLFILFVSSKITTLYSLYTFCVFQSYHFIVS